MIEAVRTIIQRQDPYVASRAADVAAQRRLARDPVRRAYFAEREVVTPEGTFPFGEGYLYTKPPGRRDPAWTPGRGVPGHVSVAGHRGTKRQQQDAFGGLRFRAGPRDVAVLAIADGVSAAGRLAAPAAKRAVEVFLRRIEWTLARMPKDHRRRHPFVERAMRRAAERADFEVVRQVLFDRHGDGRFDAGDRRALREKTGVDVPTGRLTTTRAMKLLRELGGEIAALADEGRSALTTFCATVAIGNDLYTYSCGDAVASLYRPTEAEGSRVVHLTHRDQAVVELFTADEFEPDPELFENVITEALGDASPGGGTLRRYPNLLEPGDRIIVSSDGLGPRGEGRGLDRFEIERILDGVTPERAARALVRAQVQDVAPGEYQDNVGVAVMSVDAPR